MERKICEPYVVDFIISKIKTEQSRFKAIRDNAISRKIPIVEPEVLSFMKFIIKIKKPIKILEIGTAVGYSALEIMDSCPEGAKMISIERDLDMCQEAVKNIKKYGYDKIISIVNDDALVCSKYIDDKFDFIFLDASKGHYEDFFNAYRSKMNSGCVVFCDNVFYNGMVVNDELLVKRKRTIVKRMRSFIDKVTQDSRYFSSLIPIGDGVLLLMEENDD